MVPGGLLVTGSEVSRTGGFIYPSPPRRKREREKRRENKLTVVENAADAGDFVGDPGAEGSEEWGVEGVPVGSHEVWEWGG